jgi:hypothetical protein
MIATRARGFTVSPKRLHPGDKRLLRAGHDGGQGSIVIKKKSARCRIGLHFVQASKGASQFPLGPFYNIFFRFAYVNVNDESNPHDNETSFSPPNPFPIPNSAFGWFKKISRL